MRPDIISLDVKPEIEVLEQDQLVIIKGDLVLSGHFQSPELRAGGDKEDLEGATFLPFEAGEAGLGDQQSSSIWSVTERFPIDITVPAYKVNNLDDVYLHVEQLDYTIDEQNRLNVEVEIALLGVENGLTIDQTGLINIGSRNKPMTQKKVRKIWTALTNKNRSLNWIILFYQGIGHGTTIYLKKKGKISLRRDKATIVKRHSRQIGAKGDMVRRTRGRKLN